MTQAEHTAMAAVQNENGDQQAAWDNAAIYADQDGISVEDFRSAMTSLFGFRVSA